MTSQQNTNRGAVLQRIRGFSLIELMIVVAIIGIIASVAYPAYLDNVRKGRRADGFDILNRVMQAQERNYTDSLTYVDDLTELGFPAAGNVPSGEGFYQVSAAACGAAAGDTIRDCVVLTATAQGDQANDNNGAATFTINSRGQKTGPW